MENTKYLKYLHISDFINYIMWWADEFKLKDARHYAMRKENGTVVISCLNDYTETLENKFVFNDFYCKNANKYFEEGSAYWSNFVYNHLPQEVRADYLSDCKQNLSKKDFAELEDSVYFFAELEDER